MNDQEIAELKRIHGEDVELAPDDSEDDHLTEEEALAQAKAEGIEFVDAFMVEGEAKEYKTAKLAEKHADGRNVIQVRRRKP